MYINKIAVWKVKEMKISGLAETKTPEDNHFDLTEGQLKLGCVSIDQGYM